MTKRRIAVLTDSRAEYGILKYTLSAIRDSEMLELQIIVTGTHLLEAYGFTINEIRNDGFFALEEIRTEVGLSEKTRIPTEMGNLTIQLSRIFERLHPDILLLFGDRYEMLAAASTAVAMHIPIAHISGGESTEGAMDEQIRHAITKMSHIHFPGAEVYAENIKRMGEQPWRIFNVGDPGIENIRRTQIMKKSALETDLGIKIDEKTLLVTYHPVTLELSGLACQMAHLTGALDKFNGTMIITYPNSDDGSDLIIREWKEFASGRKNVCLVKSLGMLRYLSVMNYCGAVVGNSSSAVVEAPFLKVPVVNIGNRQKGRMMADNILTCGYEQKEIERSIKTALSREFKEIASGTKSLYGDGNTSGAIVQVLEHIEIDEKLFKKKLCWDV